jgi:acyl-coenzyme A synthetase/AMP-(fatty) acid ligase
MSMPQDEPLSLWHALTGAGGLAGRWLWDRDASVELASLVGGSSFGEQFAGLRGRVVLLLVENQLPAALALIELAGHARRIVLCPLQLAAEHLPAIIAKAGVDAVVCSPGDTAAAFANIGRTVACTSKIEPVSIAREAHFDTEWVLLTSGTTGPPKLVVHTLATLTAPMARSGLGANSIWSTFYDIRRYGGLQILLRALLGGGSMVLSNHREGVAEFLTRAAAHRITYISGTPSHWRRALMTAAARRIAPRYVRLSGEIADQGILDQLRATYREAQIAHAFASTEAGVAFEVGDELAGFPASHVTDDRPGVELRVAGGSLRIRSGRTALGYLDGRVRPLADPEGFVDTTDMVERQGERFYFVGRRDGVINVGGQKVHPEEIEAVINRHPKIRMSLVKGRRSPIIGAIVVAEIVAKSEADIDGKTAQDTLGNELLAMCRATLAPYKVPAVIRFVPALDVAASGKLVRSDA